MSKTYEVGYFTIDKVLGLSKQEKYARTIMEAIDMFDRANETLYNELVRVKDENARLKQQIMGVQDDRKDI